MTETRRLVRALVASLAIFLLSAAVVGCDKPSASPSSSETTTEASAADAPDAPLQKPRLEDLKGLSLTVKEESLVFDYLIAGGLPALESRFGKPTATYTTAADEASTGSAELADERTYHVQCGIDAKGAAVVMAHGVDARQGQTQAPADTAFIKAMVDGTTTLEQANAYLKGVGGTTVRPAVMDPKGLNAPAHVWRLPDGTGFLVVDLSGLTGEQKDALEVDRTVPYQVLYWTPARWRAY